MSDKKPVIFISYAHADEPDKPVEGEIKWLSFVQKYLQPAVKNGIFDLWVDRNMLGGADWDPEIERKLRACDIFVLLVSASSMASDYVIDTEMAIIRERQANGEHVHFYPLLLTPTPDAGLNKVKDRNLRPRDARPFSSFSYHDRLQHMTDAANEIGKIAQNIVERKGAVKTSAPVTSPPYVHTIGLPETAYEDLVGREAELKRLDDAWADQSTNILSLVAEGGAGKSALVNEWLKRVQADNYRAAQLVLGWSFYSQGSKVRATSADEFLNWALEKLGIQIATISASAKAEAIAEAMMQRRVLLLLDGVEPLQHGPGTQFGQLKDQGLRALLRRFAATPPGEAHGLVVLSSRLVIKDIARWQESAAPVIDVERLSDEASAALLRDNGVWGTNKELKAAAHDFGGHPLALGLLASFLKETQTGDVRRRDCIRAYFADADNPRHDHAKRVMESYEKEWLAEQPILLGIMHVVGLFDRPVNSQTLRVLREPPEIYGFPSLFADLSNQDWNRAVTRLREVRLLAPADSVNPTTLDAHALVREWFGERLRQRAPGGWRVAHARIYHHLRDTTHEGKAPTLRDLAPLYQSIRHGCCAGLHQDVLNEIYLPRICRSGGETQYYASRRLGAHGSNLAALSWFFEQNYKTPVPTLRIRDQSWLLGHTAHTLRAQGRLVEALDAQRASIAVSARRAMIAAATMDLADAELIVGEIGTAEKTAERAIIYADKVSYKYRRGASRALCACARHMSGHRASAASLFKEAEERIQLSGSAGRRKHPLLSSVWGFRWCELLIDETSTRSRT